MAGERITGRQKDVAKMLRQRKDCVRVKSLPPARETDIGEKAGLAGRAGKAVKAVNAPGDLLSIALKNEKSERAFYLRRADVTKNRIGKAMFRRIADDELEHYRLLSHILKGNKENISGKLSGGAAEKVKEVLREQIMNTAKAPQASAGDLEAVRTAIEFEGKGASRYAEMRDRSTDPVEKRLFDLLASVEHEHFLSLRELEELLTDPASWYRWRERHGLDGG